MWKSAMVKHVKGLSSWWCPCSLIYDPIIWFSSHNTFGWARLGSLVDWDFLKIKICLKDEFCNQEWQFMTKIDWVLFNLVLLLPFLCSCWSLPIFTWGCKRAYFNHILGPVELKELHQWFIKFKHCILHVEHNVFQVKSSTANRTIVFD